MQQARTIIFAAAVTLSAGNGCFAQSLRVAPITVDVPASSSASIVNVANSGEKEVQVQARIFRWSQKGGQDILDKTSDVVLSPPQFMLKPGASNVIRVVRIAAEPVTGQETYRILLDEIPTRDKLKTGAIAIVMRQSLPVFFADPGASAAAVSWSASIHDKTLVLQASNAGQKRFKVLKLRVAGRNGQLAAIDGLAGYVLGQQRKSWDFPITDEAGELGPVQIEAMSDTGAVRATVIVRK